MPGQVSLLTLEVPLAGLSLRRSSGMSKSSLATLSREKREGLCLQSFLQLQSVTSLTRESYEGLAFHKMEQLDQALTAFMDRRYLEGDADYVGNRLLCGLR